jgi:hypothetical protein
MSEKVYLLIARFDGGYECGDYEEVLLAFSSWEKAFGARLRANEVSEWFWGNEFPYLVVREMRVR